MIPSSADFGAHLVRSDQRVAKLAAKVALLDRCDHWLVNIDAKDAASRTR
jgi:hypothetical protein